MLSSLLNVAYLLPIPFKAFFGEPAKGDAGGGIKEAPLPCLIAIGATSLGCLLLFLFPDPLHHLVTLIQTR
jgi:multicomponent Na+:H+ antiporter subunit D